MTPGDFPSSSSDLTTLICLFHQKDQAQAALQEILRAGVPDQNVTIIGGFGSGLRADESSLTELNVPEKDLRHLLAGIHQGGILITVSALTTHVEQVEAIFESHRASKIDEAVVEDDMTNRALPVISTDRETIPVLEEELVVGKRTVDAGAVRVFRRIIEIPVDQSVQVSEQHLRIERQPVDRLATGTDLGLQGERTFELIETAERLVVGKEARVVEEIVVSKQSVERTEHIHETLRHTQVEVEEIAPGADRQPTR